CIGCVMLVSVAASKGLTSWLAYLGSRSLYVFVAFFLPMAVTRVAMLRLGFENGDLITFAAVTLGVTLPLVAERMVRGTPLGFLFARPDFLKLTSAKTAMRGKPGLTVVV
ncbi:MAG TPA: acyltransferase, partial [Parvibaculum sp.]